MDIKNLNKIVLVENAPGGTANVGTSDNPVKYINQATHFYIFFDFTSVENFVSPDAQRQWFGINASNYAPLLFAQDTDTTENISYNSILYFFTLIPITLTQFITEASIRTKILLEFFSSTGETALDAGILNVFHNGSKYQIDNVLGVKYTIGQESSVFAVDDVNNPSSSIVQTWHEISIINQDITEAQAIKLTTI